MRLFTALDLPPDVLANLEDLLRKLKPRAKISWSRPENLHVTIKFVGEFPADRVGQLKQALAAMPRGGAIPVKIHKVGFYPNPHSPHNFWCGIEAAGLDALAAASDAATAALGVPRETRKFSPHLTLARIKDRPPLQSLREAIAAIPSLEFGEFEARNFYLYESKMQPGGSVYTKLSEFPLIP
jgi:2'-5' RNA ligase